MTSRIIIEMKLIIIPDDNNTLDIEVVLIS